MEKDLSNYRKSYEKRELDESAVPADPFELFGQWFRQAEAVSGPDEPNAMTLATIGLDGYPKSRVVLLKRFSKAGFVFYTNYGSDKGRAIAANPRVCLSAFWPFTEQQVIVKGRAEKISAEESERYFQSRPEGSKLGAIVSDQSRVLPSRAFLEERLARAQEKYAGGDIPRPDHWGGYLVRPDSIEFWQGRQNRLHDRLRYTLQDGNTWLLERLAP